MDGLEVGYHRRQLRLEPVDPRCGHGEDFGVLLRFLGGQFACFVGEGGLRVPSLEVDGPPDYRPLELSQRVDGRSEGVELVAAEVDVREAAVDFPVGEAEQRSRFRGSKLGQRPQAEDN